MKNYDQFKALCQAQDLVSEWLSYDVSFIDDTGILQVRYNYNAQRLWYHPDGLVTLFSQGGYATMTETVPPWPDGVMRRVFSGPMKEYVVITGNDGVTRHYVMPEVRADYAEEPLEKRRSHGMTMMPHPDKIYVPVEPLADYHISVSRKQKKDAWVKWQDFFEFADVMWELLPVNPITTPDLYTLRWDDRDTWHSYVQRARMDDDRKWLRNQVEERIMEDDLPYNVRLVPDIEISHSDHWGWDLIKELGKAGKLPEE